MLSGTASSSHAAETLDRLQELRRTEGLGKVQVRARRRAAPAFALLIRSREQHHSGCAPFRVCFDAFADFEAIHTGHHDVQDNHVSARHAQSREPGFTVGSFPHIEAACRKRQPDQQPDVGLIVDNEQLLAGSHEIDMVFAKD